MNSVFEKIKEKLETMLFSAELYNDDFNGQTVENLICFGDVVDVIDQVAEEYEEECCEWKFESNTGIVWHCGDKCKTYNIPYQMKLKDFLEEFESKCPYCGKKIKVVE